MASPASPGTRDSAESQAGPATLGSLAFQGIRGSPASLATLVLVASPATAATLGFRVIRDCLATADSQDFPGTLDFQVCLAIRVTAACRVTVGIAAQACQDIPGSLVRILGHQATQATAASAVILVIQARLVVLEQAAFLAIPVLASQATQASQVLAALEHKESSAADKNL